MGKVNMVSFGQFALMEPSLLEVEFRVVNKIQRNHGLIIFARTIWVACIFQFHRLYTLYRQVFKLPKSPKERRALVVCAAHPCCTFPSQLSCYCFTGLSGQSLVGPTLKSAGLLYRWYSRYWRLWMFHASRAIKETLIICSRVKSLGILLLSISSVLNQPKLWLMPLPNMRASCTCPSAIVSSHSWYFCYGCWWFFLLWRRAYLFLVVTEFDFCIRWV